MSYRELFMFFYEIVPFENFNDKIQIIEEIYDQIQNREKNPVENSYTNYLLDEGIDKIFKKVGEEATENVIAAKNPNKEELVGEISDLVYHMLVLMYKSGVSLDDVESKLIERHEKQGNKKKKY